MADRGNRVRLSHPEMGKLMFLKQQLMERERMPDAKALDIYATAVLTLDRLERQYQAAERIWTERQTDRVRHPQRLVDQAAENMALLRPRVDGAKRDVQQARDYLLRRLATGVMTR